MLTSDAVTDEHDARDDLAFANQLRALIQDSGMSLQEVVDELRRRSTPVTLATLSYWQTGRSRPERAASMKAVASLEDLFALERGALSSLFPERKPRGRAARSSRRTTVKDVLPVTRTVDTIRDQLGLPFRDGLERVSIHERIVMGHTRHQSTLTTRMVLRAEREGADRFLMILSIPDGDMRDYKPELGRMTNCTMGRTVLAEENTLLAVEVLLEQPLAFNESVLIETSVERRTPMDSEHTAFHERGFLYPVRDYVLECVFNGEDIPRRVEGYRLRGDAERADLVMSEPLTLRHGTAQYVVLDPGLGIVGMKWEWVKEQIDE